MVAQELILKSIIEKYKIMINYKIMLNYTKKSFNV